MAGIKGNKKHANKTSYPNQKYNNKSPRVVLRKFREMLFNAENDDDILCFEDACHSIGWRGSKVDYWIKKIPIFENLKKDIQKQIIRRINKKSLKGDFVPSPAIWRMKQLGEIEIKEVKQDLTTQGEKINQKMEIIFKDFSE